MRNVIVATVDILPVDNTHDVLILKEGQLIKQGDSFNLICIYNMSDLELAAVKMVTIL